MFVVPERVDDNGAPFSLPLLPLTPTIINCPQLYVSKDLGDTWVYLGSNISRYSWRNLDAQYESNTSLYFERNINGLCVHIWAREGGRVCVLILVFGTGQK